MSKGLAKKKHNLIQHAALEKVAASTHYLDYAFRVFNTCFNNTKKGTYSTVLCTNEE